MSRRKQKPRPTTYQAAALDEIHRIAAENTTSISLVDVLGLAEDGDLCLKLELATAELTQEQGGLPLRDRETVTVRLPAIYPLHPPVAEVDHFRFAGQPHVLQGYRLCLYLDPQREWHPEQGMVGFLNRLWRWLEDGAAARFDAGQALYHPVGGVLHQTAGAPTIVVREDLPADLRPLSRAYLVPRAAHRFDLTWKRPEAGVRSEPAALIRLRDPLYFSAGNTLHSLLATTARPRLESPLARAVHHGWPPPDAILTALAMVAQRGMSGTPSYFVIAVPHPATGDHHLLTGRLPSGTADSLRQLVQTSTLGRVLDPSALRSDSRMEWCVMSDERPRISTRRDARRPISTFQGKHVHIWGCGGIGSWMAEFVARAGASRIVLCDNGRVAGGLLVRQNYTEADVGRDKANALAERLRAIRDDLTVISLDGHALAQDSEPWHEADVLIDATVNTAVAYGFDQLRVHADQRPTVAQVAIDLRTGTLGIMSVASPSHSVGLSIIDRDAGTRVLADPDLERFHTFWQDAGPGDEVVPARGCSVPTFHGSAADLAAIAATLTTLLAIHLGTDSDTSGTHVVALPHAEGIGPDRVFLASGGPLA